MHGRIRSYLPMAVIALLLAMVPSCKKVEPDPPEETPPAKEVTIVFGTRGLNDLVYNDLILKGVMAAVGGYPELVPHLRCPANLSEAAAEMDAWLASPVIDKALIFCGKEYESLVEGVDAGTGRILLLDSDKTGGPGCCSALIRRYGASWLVGALLKDKAPVFIKDPKQDPVMSLIEQGIEDGYVENGGEKLDSFVPEGEMIESLYNWPKWYSGRDQISVPTCGILQTEVFLFIKHLQLNALGIGTDCSNQSDLLPFSLTFDLSGIVRRYITDWAQDIEWAQQADYGLSTGHASIVYNNRYFSGKYANAFPQKAVLDELYAQFYNQALEKEASHAY